MIKYTPIEGLKQDRDIIYNFIEQNKFKLALPAVYEGREMNSIQKPWDGNYKTRGIFCIPVAYEAGINNLGVAILYNMINENKDLYCERSYMPDSRLYKYMVNNKIPVGFGWESKHPFIDYDWIGFSSYFELQFFNIVDMLHKSGIPVYSSERNDNSYPLIMLGGISAYSCEPVADIVDVVFIGDGESQVVEMQPYLVEYKQGKITKEELLLKLTNNIKGVYVPCFYNFYYDEGSDGLYIKGFEPKPEYKGRVPERITKAFFDITKREPFYRCFLPSMDGNMLGYNNVEISRGCHNSCRFCMASACHKPYREHSLESISKAMVEGAKFLGSKNISPYSLNYSSYSQRNSLAKYLAENTSKSIITSTQRVDTFSAPLSKALAETGNRGATFAIEAGSQRLRDVVNKEISEEHILHAIKSIIDQGYTRLKIYMISNLPFETPEDRWAIIPLMKQIYDYKKEKGSNIKIRISYTEFTAKPFTALQWADVSDWSDKLEEEGIYNELTNLEIVYQRSISGVNHFLLQLLNRVDRRFCDVLVDATLNYGVIFTEKEIMRGKDVEGLMNDLTIKYIGHPMIERLKEYPEDAIFPWDILSNGIDKEWLKGEWRKARQASLTPSCMKKCSRCGACFDEEMKAQGAKIPLYHKVNEDIPEEELIEAILEGKGKLDNSINKILISLIIDPKARFYPQSKLKLMLKSAFHTAGINIKEKIELASESCQFDNWVYGKDLAVVSTFDMVTSVSKEQIDMINERMKGMFILDELKIFKANDITSLKGMLDYALYEAKFRVDNPEKVVEQMNFDNKEIVIRQKQRGDRQDRVVYKETPAFIYKSTAKHLGSGFIKARISVPLIINIYDVVRHLADIENKRDILKYPIERITYFKVPETSSLVFGRCECGNAKEISFNGRPCGDKCVSCFSESLEKKDKESKPA